MPESNQYISNNDFVLRSTTIGVSEWSHEKMEVFNEENSQKHYFFVFAGFSNDFTIDPGIYVS